MPEFGLQPFGTFQPFPQMHMMQGFGGFIPQYAPSAMIPPAGMFSESLGEADRMQTAAKTTSAPTDTAEPKKVATKTAAVRKPATPSAGAKTEAAAVASKAKTPSTRSGGVVDKTARPWARKQAAPKTAEISVQTSFVEGTCCTRRS